MNKGKIVKIVSNAFTVQDLDKKSICRARGKFRNDGIVPMVGDNVVVSDGIITEILPRKNELVRPFVSNVDQAVIVASVKSPDLSLNLLDKLIAVIEFNRIRPVICFTKLDLLDDKTEISNIMHYYKSIGYDVYTNETDEIKNIFKNKVTVFTGQTGAGKSTLLNKLEKTLNINTAEISKALGRGKHTTRHVELYDILDGLVADTPGFSALSLSEMTPSDIRDNFIEFNEYKGECKYRDCMHDREDDCEIKKLVSAGKILKSRYENYLKFISEV